MRRRSHPGGDRLDIVSATGNGLRTARSPSTAMKRRTAESPSASDADVARTPISNTEPAGVVAAGEHSAGFVTYDDLGRPRWSWADELDPETNETDPDDVRKALETDALSLADEPGAAPLRRADKEKGYDPYDTARINDRFRRRR